jgi:superfamily II DNA or RNA helicase
VLCNHSVLSVGFDAPRTDMVLISRQVFSPVRYMQMVGRGLRGDQVAAEILRAPATRSRIQEPIVGFLWLRTCGRVDSGLQ